jgi:ADP-dependent NAD(P)H-hydrate dehydratase / NAD(P)H-hydrate epimerase
MTELLTAAQMRAIEAAAITSGEVTGLELMERAGRGVVDAVFAEWPELKAGSFKAVVLCGPGNNGGDGFVVARLLKDWGWEVQVFHYGSAEGLPPDARINHDRWAALGQVGRLADAVGSAGPDVRLVIDAIFGAGLKRPLPPDVKAALRHIRDEHRQAYFVAVDCVSGECLDSGRQIGGGDDLPIDRDLVVQFHRPKIGQYMQPAAGWTWSLRVADIGLTDVPAQVVRLVRPMDRRLKKGATRHKFSHGHALVLSGGPGKGGAARITARGALRIGAGLVTLGVPPAALQENAARLDAVMLRSVKDADALSAWLHDDDRINALCVGPGFGTTTRHAEFVEAVLDTKRTAVLDADGLTLLAQDKALFGKLHPKCVLTPHGGEFARLFPDIASRLAEPATKGPAYSKVDAARDAAAQAGCIVLYKGPDTVIADPQGCCSINSAQFDRAAPWLATAGSGDVLAGFITGLLARGFAPMQAAETAAWLHVECARRFGPGLIAEDLPDLLPAVFRALGA